MTEKYAYSEEAQWLQSDGKILTRLRKSQGKKGILLELDMPDGMGSLLVEVVKTDAGSMTQFCEMARGAYNERKAEQEAKASRKGNDDRHGASPAVQGAVPVPQTTVAIDLDLGSVGTKLLEVQTRLFDVLAEKGKLEREQDILLKILEVLSAYEDDAKELPCIREQESAGDGPGVGKKACEDSFQRRGETDTGGEDRATPIASLPTPDTDAVDGSKD